MGYPAEAVARFLGVTTSAVVRAARAEELPDRATHQVEIFSNNLTPL